MFTYIYVCVCSVTVYRTVHVYQNVVVCSYHSGMVNQNMSICIRIYTCVCVFCNGVTY